MKQLTGIKLINWHYFTNETIPIEGSALITGNNKAGKSTLIDALQVVIVSNMKKILFNAAAFDEKTERDLKSYLRGRTGTEGKYTYLRGNEEDFSSYIVLEITHTATNKPSLIGVVFDYYCESGEEEHVFFIIDGCPLNDDLFLQDGYPRNRKQFFRHIKARGLNCRQYRNDVEGYRNDLRQLLGGIKETFFSLFVKGISFKPITNLRKFVYDYILEERPVDVDTMRDYAERYRQMENQLLNTEAEIAALEEVCGEFEKVENLRRGSDNMPDKITVSSVLNSLVPISRFNKGEANKIFEEVREAGFKVVLKNNTPACVLLKPELYEQMLETIEEYRLLLEAEKRMKNAKQEDFIPQEKVLSEFGINKADLDNTDVEIE
jgi:PHD/YefM family antitoxin component YafN of YafNO toxin-antitoxin module